MTPQDTEATREDAGPAFPPVHDPKTHPSGMSLRDYFAGKALMHVYSDRDPFTAARDAYRLADAMLAERSK